MLCSYVTRREVRFICFCSLKREATWVQRLLYLTFARVLHNPYGSLPAQWGAYRHTRPDPSRPGCVPALPCLCSQITYRKRAGVRHEQGRLARALRQNLSLLRLLAPHPRNAAWASRDQNMRCAALGNLHRAWTSAGGSSPVFAGSTFCTRAAAPFAAPLRTWRGRRPSPSSPAPREGCRRGRWS